MKRWTLIACAVLVLAASVRPALGQTERPRFHRYVLGMAAGAAGGMVVTGLSLAANGYWEKGDWLAPALMCCIGIPVGSNVGCIVAADNRFKVYGSNLILTTIPFAVLTLLDKTYALSGLYTCMIIPWLVALNAYRIDHNIWKSQHSTALQPVPLDQWRQAGPGIEPVRFQFRVNLLTLSF